MTTFSVDRSGLSTIAVAVAPTQSALASVTIAAPSTSMYGALVGSAAADAEPETTTELVDLVHALAAQYGSVADRLQESSRCYAQVETDNTTLAHQITKALA